MPGARLALTASPDVAASSDEGQRDDDGEDGRKTGAEASPMEIDEGKTVVELIQGDICRLMIDLVGD